MEKNKSFLREEIDVIDDKITTLLINRFALARQIGEIKRAEGHAIKDEKREREVLNKVSSFAVSEGEKEALTAIYTCILSECSNMQK